MYHHALPPYNYWCSKPVLYSSAMPPSSMYVEAITEERAARCLARIDLLQKIREQILWHPKLNERMKLCQPGPEMPDWWVSGEHDKELLIGAAKWGNVYQFSLFYWPFNMHLNSPVVY